MTEKKGLNIIYVGLSWFLRVYIIRLEERRLINMEQILDDYSQPGAFLGP